MLIGVFADSHDHLENLRKAVAFFNGRGCQVVLFAGDLVSTFALPPLRRLECPLVGCYGDNEGNKVGLQAGLRRGDILGEPPFGWIAPDGTRVLLAHIKRHMRGWEHQAEVCICAHTHKPRLYRDEEGRLWINPGEAGGWTFGVPTVALLDTASRSVEIISLASERVLTHG